jgi:hypothetical protein
LPDFLEIHHGAAFFVLGFFGKFLPQTHLAP